MNTNIKIKYNYDKQVDVLYASLGNPQKAMSIEVGNGTLLRLNPQTRKVVGFTVYGYMKRINAGLLETIPSFEDIELPKFE